MKKKLASMRFIWRGSNGSSIPLPPTVLTTAHKAPPSDDLDLLEALFEVEQLLAPALAQDRVPPEVAIAFLADGMSTRIIGEMESPPSHKLRTRHCQYILLV